MTDGGLQDLPDPDAIVASALYLMTRQAGGCCPCKARLVIRQLELLANHPGDGVAPILRQVCRKLVLEWHGLIQAMQNPEAVSGANPTRH